MISEPTLELFQMILQLKETLMMVSESTSIELILRLTLHQFHFKKKEEELMLFIAKFLTVKMFKTIFINPCMIKMKIENQN